MGVSNIFESAYYLQTKGQVERYNRSLLAMLHTYVIEHQNDWEA